MVKLYEINNYNGSEINIVSYILSCKVVSMISGRDILVTITARVN